MPEKHKEPTSDIPRPCPLCREMFQPREQSHILPAFAYRWLKDSSATGAIRFGPQMNRRVQDGIKDYFLCPTCEDRFQKWETPFATKIFHPYTKNPNHTVRYEEYFLKFAVSLSWRVLAYGKERLGLNKFRGRHSQELDETLATWRDYLLGEHADLGSHVVHSIVWCGVADHSMKDVPPNLNRYLLRTTEMDVVVSDQNAFVYSKLGPLIFVGIIVFPDTYEWENTEVRPSGDFGPGQFRAPGMLLHYIFSRCERLAALESGISPNQLSKIEAAYEKNRSRAEQSGTLGATILDILLEEKRNNPDDSDS